MGPHVTDRLSAYLDGELPVSERDGVEVHLDGCADCARHLEELRAVDGVARRLPLGVPDGYFAAFPERVRARLARQRPRPRVGPAWLAAAAAAVVLAALAPRLWLDARRARIAPPAPAPAAQEVPATLIAEERDKIAAAPAPEARREVAQSRPGPRRAVEAPRATPAAPPAAAAPAAPAGGRSDAPTMAADETQALRYAEAPAEDAARPAQRNEAATNVAAAETKEQIARAERDLSSERLKGAVAGAAAGPDPRFEALLRRAASSADEARKLREAWRAYAREAREGARADEARVRAVEAGVEAWRRGGDAADRARAERDARSYLERPDARQAARVRAVLESLRP